MREFMLMPGIIEREGLAKVRHVEVDVLWLQEQQARSRLPLVKVAGTANPADLGTKNLSRAEIMKNIEIMGMVELEGRAAKAAQLHYASRSVQEIVREETAECEADVDLTRPRRQVGPETLSSETCSVHAIQNTKRPSQGPAPHHEKAHDR